MELRKVFILKTETRHGDPEVTLYGDNHEMLTAAYTFLLNHHGDAFMQHCVDHHLSGPSGTPDTSEAIVGYVERLQAEDCAKCYMDSQEVEFP